MPLPFLVLFYNSQLFFLRWLCLSIDFDGEIRKTLISERFNCLPWLTYFSFHLVVSEEILNFIITICQVS